MTALPPHFLVYFIESASRKTIFFFILEVAYSLDSLYVIGFVWFSFLHTHTCLHKLLREVCCLLHVLTEAYTCFLDGVEHLII